MATKKKAPAKKAPARKVTRAPTPAKRRPAKKAAPAKKSAKWTRATLADAKEPKAKPEDESPWGKAKKKLDSIGIGGVVAQIVDGTMLTVIAIRAGVSIGSLLTWLDATPERSARAREARRLGAAHLEEQAHQAIVDAKKPFDLQKARELAHHLRWKASKLDPRGFGDKLALGAAVDLPPLPTPEPAQTNVNLRLEIAPGEAYAQMLARKKA